MMFTFSLLSACYEPAPDSYTKDTQDSEVVDTDTGSVDTDTGGGDTDTGVVDTETGGIDSDTAPVAVEHCGDVTDDEFWAVIDGPHVVTCMVHVNGGTLTIEGGQVITFASSGGISVADDGGVGVLFLAGTTEAPLALQGESDADAWQGLRVEGYGMLQLMHAELVNGGSSKATIYADGGEVYVDDVAVTGSKTYGVQIKNSAGFYTGSTNLRVSGSADFPVVIGVEAAHTLPDGVWTGNTFDGIEVAGGTLDTAATWPALEVPWVIAGDVDVEGTRDNPATWTLSPGATLAFEAGAGLSFSPDGGASALIAEGTESAPILLTAWDAAERGIWGGVSIEGGAESVRLVHTTIEYGGGAGMLDVTGADVYADALTLRGAPSAAFLLGEDARFAEGSGALVVEDAGWPGQIEAAAVSSLATMDLDLLGADEDWLYVTAAATITAPMEWPDLGLPYWLNDSLSLDGTAEAPAVWTVDPGVSIYVAANKYIRVSHAGGAAGLLAVGTEGAPITFTSASSATAGAWGGIGIYGDAVDSSCVFDHVDIGYGGGSGLSGNLHLDDASPTIDHAFVHDSADYGIYRAGDAAPVIGEVTYSGNEDGDLF